MKLKIDLSKCAMSGQCYYFHPNLVRMREDGFPELIASGVTNANEEAITDLLETCPLVAIDKEDE